MRAYIVLSSEELVTRAYASADRHRIDRHQIDVACVIMMPTLLSISSKISQSNAADQHSFIHSFGHAPSRTPPAPERERRGWSDVVRVR